MRAFMGNKVIIIYQLCKLKAHLPKNFLQSGQDLKIFKEKEVFQLRILHHANAFDVEKIFLRFEFYITNLNFIC